MSNSVKQSLEQNKDEILANLPEEFHSDFTASIEVAVDSQKLSPEQAKLEAADLMREDPNIDEAACIPLLDSDLDIACPISQPGEDELEDQKKELLAHIAQELET